MTSMQKCERSFSLDSMRWRNAYVLRTYAFRYLSKLRLNVGGVNLSDFKLLSNARKTVLGMKARTGTKHPLPLHQLQQPPLHRPQHPRQLVPALEHLAALAEQGPHALLAAQRRALLDARLRTLGGAAEGAEAGGVAGEIHRVVAPLARRDHPAVDI